MSIFNKYSKLKDSASELYQNKSQIKKEKEDELSKLYYAKRDEESELSSKYYKLQNEATLKAETKISKLEEENKAAMEEKAELEKTLRYYAIRQSLGEPQAGTWDDHNKPAAHILFKEETSSAQIIGYIFPNKKPKNKYDLRVAIKCKSLKLRDVYQCEYHIINYNDLVFEKSFPKELDAILYFNKNSHKILSNFREAENDFMKRTQHLDIDLAKEFDLRLIHTNYSGRSIVDSSADHFVFSEVNYNNPEREKQERVIRVEKDGKGGFAVSGSYKAQDHEKVLEMAAECLEHNKPLFVPNPKVYLLQNA